MARADEWSELRVPDLAGLDPETTVALLPLGATEAHGPHLPVGTDSLINAGIVAAARARIEEPARLLVLPALPVGLSLEHAAFAGTLSASAETLLALWTEIGRGVAAAGLRKLILFNSHGGQTALVDLVAVRLRADARMLVARVHWGDLGIPDGLFAPDETACGLHGGEVETSLLLHLAPELVDLTEAPGGAGLPAALARRNELLGVEAPVGIGWLSQDLGPAGVCGNARSADAARGAVLLDHLADRLARLVGEMAATPLAILR
jgi:creatinine amidohydrolase